MFLLLIALACVARAAEETLKSLPEDRCTTMIVGAKAGADGPMTTHTADCANCDFRVNKVPAKDWPEGARRALYVYKPDYPALISKDRGDTWDPSNLEGSPDQLNEWGEESEITGHIPQVSIRRGHHYGSICIHVHI
jgi:hypothetical protein